MTKQGFHLIVGILARWQPLQDEVGMKLTCALLAGFVEEQHLRAGIFTSTVD